jgi:TRAP-type C4-dicarboxylate transport system substrate-binding protein
MRKTIARVLALTAICALALAGTGFAAEKTYVMKLSTQLNETTPMVQGFKQLAENVKKASNGRLTIQVFPSAQLGSDEDVIEQAMQGVNVAVLTDGGRMGNYVREFGIIGMAYFADKYDDILKVVESPTYKDWEARLSKEGIHVLSFNWYDGPRHFLTHKEIKVPADLNGLRIRTPGAPAWAESVRALGATPIAMPWGEVYSAVQSKAIDGCEVQDTSTLGSRTYEVLKYRNKTSHFQLINGLIVGEKWFQTLPADLQKILVDETKAEGQRNAKLVENTIADIEKKLTEFGMITTSPDVAAFKKAADAAYEKLNFTALRVQIYKEIGK